MINTADAMQALKKPWVAMPPVTAFGAVADWSDPTMSKVGTTYAAPKANVRNFAGASLTASAGIIRN